MPESIPAPSVTREEAIADEEKKRPLHDEQVDRVLLPLIEKMFASQDLDAKKIASIADKHRDAARELMDNKQVTPAEVVAWLEAAIREGERKISGYQQAARAEREFGANPVTMAQAAEFTKLVGMKDERQRELGVIGLIAEMAAAELNTAITDSRVQDIAEHLKPVLKNTMRLFPDKPEASVESLRGTVRSAVQQLRRQNSEAPEASTGGNL